MKSLLLVLPGLIVGGAALMGVLERGRRVSGEF